MLNESVCPRAVYILLVSIYQHISTARWRGTLWWRLLLAYKHSASTVARAQFWSPSYTPLCDHAFHTSSENLHEDRIQCLSMYNYIKHSLGNQFNCSRTLSEVKSQWFPYCQVIQFCRGLTRHLLGNCSGWELYFVVIGTVWKLCNSCLTWWHKLRLRFHLFCSWILSWSWLVSISIKTRYDDD